MRDAIQATEKQRLHDAGALIYHVVGQFNATSRSVEAFLPLGRQVKRLDSPARLRRKFDTLTKHLSQADRQVARERINTIIDAQFARHGAEPSIDAPATAEAAQIPPADPPVQPSMPAHVSVEVAIVVDRLARAFYIDLHTPMHLPMFHRALLTTQIAALEQLVGALYQAFLMAYPDSLGSTKTLTVADLHRYISIQDAIDAALEDEVDAFRRDSVATWDKWFQERLNLKFADHAADYPRLIEAIERRNVVVHNASRVSRQYLTRLKGMALPPLGSELPIDADYLRRVLDDTLVFGNLLAYGTWRKLKPDRDVDGLSDDTMFDLMTVGRWEATRAYCERALSLGHYGTEVGRLVLGVNRWLAIKRTEGVAAIRVEVEAWDVSALGANFTMAREALLDHADHLAAEIRHLLTAGDLPLELLHTWPILEEFRASQAYADLLAERAP